MYGGFPGGSDGKASACNAGDPGSIPRLGRSLGEGNGKPFDILSWRILWTEGPAGLWSMGLKELDTSYLACMHAAFMLNVKSYKHLIFVHCIVFLNDNIVLITHSIS